MKTLDDYPNRGRGTAGYFAFLRERESIRVAKEERGEPGPWTDDPVLREWRFCNVRREDDRLTRWFREELRDPFDEEQIAWMPWLCAAFRWFNTEAAGEVLKRHLTYTPPHVGEAFVSDLGDVAADPSQRLFTGAYIVNSRPGRPKHIDVALNLQWMAVSPASPFGWDRLPRERTKEACMKALLEVPRLGNFLAYQVVVDLTWTHVLRDAADMNTFTVLGPGAARGLSWIFYDEPEGYYNYGSRSHQERMLDATRELHAAQSEHWDERRYGGSIRLSDIENGLCEYAKWRAGHTGARQKRRYQPRKP